MIRGLASSILVLILLAWAIMDTESFVAVFEVALSAFVTMVRTIADVAESELT